MSAAKWDILIECGATFREQVAALADENAPVDLTGASVRASVREAYVSTSALLTFTCEVTAPLEGTFTIGATPEVTAALESGRYVWDCEIEFPGGDVTRLAQGLAIVSPEVTRD